jgi:hypothetical protein
MSWKVKLGDTYRKREQGHFDRDLSLHTRLERGGVNREDWLEVSHVWEALARSHSWHCRRIESIESLLHVW